MRFSQEQQETALQLLTDRQFSLQPAETVRLVEKPAAPRRKAYYEFLRQQMQQLPVQTLNFVEERRLLDAGVQKFHLDASSANGLLAQVRSELGFSHLGQTEAVRGASVLLGQALASREGLTAEKRKEIIAEVASWGLNEDQLRELELECQARHFHRTAGKAKRRNVAIGLIAGGLLLAGYIVAMIGLTRREMPRTVSDAPPIPQFQAHPWQDRRLQLDIVQGRGLGPQLTSFFDALNQDEQQRLDAVTTFLSRDPMHGLNAEQHHNLADVVAGLIACEPHQANATAIIEVVAQAVGRRSRDSYLYAHEYATRDWGLETLLLLQLRPGASTARQAKALRALNAELGNVLDDAPTANHPLTEVAHKAALAVLLTHYAELRKAAHDQPAALWQLHEAVVPASRRAAFTDALEVKLIDDGLASMLCTYIETDAPQWESWRPQLQRLILTAPPDRLQRFETSAAACRNTSLQSSLTTWIDAKK
jgi:hypothetical protein